MRLASVSLDSSCLSYPDNSAGMVGWWDGAG